MKLKRYDRITLDRSRAVVLDNGFLRVPAKISRVGVQAYRRGDGSLENAYRPADEVGNPASVAGFEGAVVVDNHPRENNSVVDKTNAKRLSVGVVLNPVFRDGFVEADLIIQDEDQIAKIQSGKVELSAGYFMDRDETPGVSPDGQPYDFVQRNIRPNHVAIVDEGRAGPECRIQLDAADAISTDVPVMVTARGGDKPPTTQEAPKMKMTIDGIECEVDNMTAQMIAKERKTSEELLTAARGESSKLKTDFEKKIAECDTANDKIAKLETELKAAPEKLKTAMAERTALEAQVTKVSPDFKCDGLDNMAVRRGVLTKAGVKLTRDSEEYVIARFDSFVESSDPKKNPAADEVDAALKKKNTTTDTNEVDTEALKAKMNADFFNPTAAK